MLKCNPATTQADIELSELYLKDYIYNPLKLPVSYNYRGFVYHGLPKDSVVSRSFIDANIIQTIYTARVGKNRELEVKAECFAYRDYPVVEWTVYFTNISENNSDILSDVKSIDTAICGKSNENAVLVHNNGDFYKEDGYTVTHLKMTESVKFIQSSQGGRCCDSAFPYQRILFNDFGFNLSIGWPGQWFCEHEGIKNGISLKAGQEDVYTYLKPGETFRTPRMTLMVFNGDETRGINVWRRWFNVHVTPKVNGKIVQPKLVMSDNGGGIEFTKATEKNQLDSIAYVKENKINADLWWIDAGWYPCGKEETDVMIWADYVGSWYPDPERFPNGLSPIGKAAKDAGMEFLVWFEPERVRKKSWLGRERPGWLLCRKEDYGEYLLNLINPDCFKWLCETISTLLKESGITCYRQDFNMEPIYFWHDNDGENRRGITENKYIQAYLAYWDYLLINVPNLWIDSCASGGRRNDMETMRRSVPLHPTDYGYGYHHINQAFRHTLFSWFPYTRSWTGSWDVNNEYYAHDDYYQTDNVSFDNFKLINGMGAMTAIGVISDFNTLNGDFSYAYTIINIWKKFSRILLHGDFYPLTENHRDNTKWTVFQFDQPEQGNGAFQVLRNNQAKDESLTVSPFGICPECDYLFTNEETGESYTRPGREIIENGITFTQPLRSGAVWFYRKSGDGCYE